MGVGRRKNLVTTEKDLYGLCVLCVAFVSMARRRIDADASNLLVRHVPCCGSLDPTLVIDPLVGQWVPSATTCVWYRIQCTTVGSDF